jgi:hypothetical protein
MVSTGKIADVFGSGDRPNSRQEGWRGRGQVDDVSLHALHWCVSVRLQEGELQLMEVLIGCALILVRGIFRTIEFGSVRHPSSFS